MSASSPLRSSGTAQSALPFSSILEVMMKISALLVFVLCISGISVSSRAEEGSLEFTPHNGFSGLSAARPAAEPERYASDEKEWHVLANNE